MSFKYQLTPSQKEAVYSALACSPDAYLLPYAESKQLDIELAPENRNKPELELSDRAVSLILQGIKIAIERQQSDMGDWARSVDYEMAREILIRKTRAQFKAVK